MKKTLEEALAYIDGCDYEDDATKVELEALRSQLRKALAAEEEPRYTVEEFQQAMATLPAIESMVMMLNIPFDGDNETKADFTMKAIFAGMEIARAVLSEGGGADLQVRAPKCPQCGTLDIDMEATDLESKKVVCYPHGHVYELNHDNSIPASEAS